MNREEFKQICLQAGFKEVEGEEGKMFPFRFDLADEFDDEVADAPPHIFYQAFSNQHGFVFSSGLGYEFVHLNTMDPEEAVKWGKMISHIEPNF